MGFYPGRVGGGGTFSGRKYIKGWGFHEFKYRKGLGKLSFWVFKQGLSKFLVEYVKGVPFSMESV